MPFGTLSFYLVRPCLFSSFRYVVMSCLALNDSSLESLICYKGSFRLSCLLNVYNHIQLFPLMSRLSIHPLPHAPVLFSILENDLLITVNRAINPSTFSLVFTPLLPSPLRLTLKAFTTIHPYPHSLVGLSLVEIDDEMYYAHSVDPSSSSVML